MTRSGRRQITLVTPQFERVGLVAAGELFAFLQAQGLAARRSQVTANELIVFPASLEPAVREVTDKVSPWVRNPLRLTVTLARRIDERGRAAFVPRLRVLRHYFNARGFATAMQRMAAAIPGSEVYIPPGRYGNLWIFGVRRRADDETRPRGEAT